MAAGVHVRGGWLCEWRGEAVTGPELLTETEPSPEGVRAVRLLLESCVTATTFIRATIQALRIMSDDSDPVAASLESQLAELAELEAGQL